MVEVLQAAHIQPYVDERKNGICLRADLHRLLDEGLVTIDDDYKIIVSTRLASASKGYGDLNGS